MKKQGDYMKQSHPTPLWLKWLYVLLITFGIIVFIYHFFIPKEEKFCFVDPNGERNECFVKKIKSISSLRGASVLN